MSKGSQRRPNSLNWKDWERRYDQIFKPKPREEATDGYIRKSDGADEKR